MHEPLPRRAFLRGAGALAAAGALGAALRWDRLTAVAADASTTGTPFEVKAAGDAEAAFPQSVASGDPTPTGVLLWTRVDPDVYAGGDVAVEVARDVNFGDVVYRGLVPASRIGRHNDHTIRVDLDGLLEPDRHYHYRFIHEGTASPVGRCRTLPAEGASVRRVRFAVLTCQNYQNGYFTALGHVAREEVDFVLHLGDFIYEYNGDASYNGKRFPGRGIDLPSGAARMETQEDLYHVWRTYRSDPHLKRMLERHTLIATWDDHEIANDRSFDYGEGRHYGDDGFRLNDDPERLDAFFRHGAKAYFEYLPVRMELDVAASDPLDVVKLYRRFRFGDLVDLFMLDERWYRSRQAEYGPDNFSAYEEGARADPARTLLGTQQRAWLFEGLKGSACTWKLLGNQVQVSPLAATLPGTSIYYNLDAWDGYEAERRALADTLAGVPNAIVLTGDLHSYMVAYVMRDHDRPLPRSPGNLVAVELMTPGVTSAGLGELVEQGLGNRGPLPPGFDAAHEAAVLAGNPHMEHFNSNRHGYSVVEITPERARYEGYVVDKSTPHLDEAPFLMSVYEVPAGRPDIREVHRADPDGLPLGEREAALHAFDPRFRDGVQGAIEVRDVHDTPEAVRAGGTHGALVLRRLPPLP